MLMIFLCLTFGQVCPWTANGLAKLAARPTQTANANVGLDIQSWDQSLSGGCRNCTAVWGYPLRRIFFWEQKTNKHKTHKHFSDGPCGTIVPGTNPHPSQGQTGQNGDFKNFSCGIKQGQAVCPRDGSHFVPGRGPICPRDGSCLSRTPSPPKMFMFIVFFSFFRRMFQKVREGCGCFCRVFPGVLEESSGKTLLEKLSWITKCLTRKGKPAANIGSTLPRTLCRPSVRGVFRNRQLQPSQVFLSISLRFQIANSESQLSPQILHKIAEKIAEWNRKSLRFEIANSKSQCFFLWNSKDKSKVPKFSEIRNRCDFWGRDFKSQRFCIFDIAAFSGR